MVKNDFETLLIGTSPFVLFEAFRLGNEGRKVLILDRRSTIGGAWYTTTVGEFDGIEMGCHFIERNLAAYKFLENILGNAPIAMDPQPYLIYKNMTFDRSSRFPWYVEKLKGALSQGEWKSSALLLGKTIKLFFETFYTQSSSYLYPKMGCQEITDALERIAKHKNVTIKYEVEVQGIEIENGKVKCHSTDGLYVFDEMVTSSCTDLSEIIVDNNKIDVEQEFKHQQHVLMYIKGKKRRRFSYFEVAGHASLLRISDVGVYSQSFSEKTGDDELMVCIQVSENSWNNKNSLKELAEKLLLDLIKLKVIKRGATLIDCWGEHFDCAVMSDAELDRITKLSGGALRSLKTFDFGCGLGNYAEPWNLFDCKENN